MIRRWILPCALVVAFAAGLTFLPEFIDLSSLMLTLGGPLAIIGFTYTRAQLLSLANTIRALCKEKSPRTEDRIRELTRLTRLYRLKGVRGLEGQEPFITDPFLRQGVALVVDLRKEEEVHAKLQQCFVESIAELEIARQILQNLGKLLPAFGLIGTLIGMVLLLRNFSDIEVSALPRALSFAVLTTLYGALFANVIVAPVAARLQAVAVKKEQIMRLTADWLVVLLRGDAADRIDGKLRSFASTPTFEILPEREWQSIILSMQR